MKLKRAIELCQAPLDETRSQLVKVNRFALIHVLAYQAEMTEAFKSAKLLIEKQQEIINNLEPYESFVLAKQEAEFKTWLEEKKKAEEAVAEAAAA